MAMRIPPRRNSDPPRRVALLGRHPRLVLYVSSMWVSGITQGLMWRAYDSLGFLKYSFVETVEAMHWPYVIRATGGSLFLLGGILMAINVWRTIRGDVSDRSRRAAGVGGGGRAARRCRGSACGVRGRS